MNETATEQKPQDLDLSELKPANRVLTEKDDAVILFLHQEYNYSTYQIAEYLDSSQATVYRHLIKALKSSQRLKEFKNKRADVLAYAQMEEDEIQALMRQQLLGEGNLNGLSEAERRAWYFTLNTSKGTNYDKERLERGKSTQNIDYSASTKTVEDLDSRIKELEAEEMKLTDGVYEVKDD